MSQPMRPLADLAFNITIQAIKDSTGGINAYRPSEKRKDLQRVGSLKHYTWRAGSMNPASSLEAFHEGYLYGTATLMPCPNNAAGVVFTNTDATEQSVSSAPGTWFAPSFQLNSQARTVELRIGQGDNHSLPPGCVSSWVQVVHPVQAGQYAEDQGHSEWRSHLIGGLPYILASVASTSSPSHLDTVFSSTCFRTNTSGRPVWRPHGYERESKISAELLVWHRLDTNDSAVKRGYIVKVYVYPSSQGQGSQPWELDALRDGRPEYGPFFCG